MTDNPHEIIYTIDSLESELRQHDKNILRLQQQMSMYGVGETPLWLSNSLDHELSRVEEIRLGIAQAKRRLEELAAEQRRKQNIQLAIMASSIGFVVILCLGVAFLIFRKGPATGESDPPSSIVGRRSVLANYTAQLSLGDAAPHWTLRAYFKEPPAGSIVAPNGVSFNFDSNSPVLETESETSYAGRVITIPVNIARPQAIHILINLSYGYKCYDGQTVGQLRFNSSNGTSLHYNLIAGDNIREWVNDPASQQDVVSGLASRAGLYPEVWQGQHAESGRKVVIDMLSLGIPADSQQYTLSSITIEDYGLFSPDLFERCRQTLYPTISPDARDPGIIIWGIDVESQ
jgi:hypothetical protein